MVSSFCWGEAGYGVLVFFQLLMHSILSHSFLILLLHGVGLLFILLEYLVLHCKAELLFEQTADIDLPFVGWGELNPHLTCSHPLRPQLPLSVISH